MSYAHKHIPLACVVEEKIDTICLYFAVMVQLSK